MFKSKNRPLVIPQLEHARLSGHIAQFWGNTTVDRPPIDAASFTDGVIHHDRGYGHLDTMAIGGVDEAVWLATQKRGILTSLVDPIADTVALMHIRRLVASGDRENVTDVIALADTYIERNIAQTDYTAQNFADADRITNICDMISFYFCFEAPKQFSMPVFIQGTLQNVQVNIVGDGHVTLDPWPLHVPTLRGYILGYTLHGYPDHPQPVTIPFEITPTTNAAQ